MTQNQPAVEQEALIVRSADGVATVTINRPRRKNAIAHALWLELARRFTALSADPAVHAIVLAGAGGDFSAGADIAEFDTLRGSGNAEAYEAANSAAFAAVREARVPVIAAIRGVCFGGGFGLAAAADLRIAAPDALFSVPAARLGLAYPQDAMQDIVAAAGPQMARYLTFTGARIGAEAALAAGFVLEIVPAAELDARAAAIAAAIAANAPLSVHASKLAIRAELSGAAADGEAARTAGALTFESADYAEGRAAFGEKRQPRFSGR
ncbi:MAG: enoyl-CoA hydratase/isomerase family protein [Mesorhizobium sp.]|nr:enoyl-CoA hydratase-related protein [Mesorhizobium sp.]MBN9244513.1 enoyl-CoA hydratase/isomerase family protein [Mesorhizobium sp.]